MKIVIYEIEEWKRKTRHSGRNHSSFGTDFSLPLTAAHTAAHTAVGKELGMSEEETIEARKGEADDGKTAAALRFAVRIAEERGFVGDEDLEAVWNAGWDDAGIIAIIGVVALNLFTNTFNHVVETECDFPEAPSISSS